MHCFSYGTLTFTEAWKGNEAMRDNEAAEDTDMRSNAAQQPMGRCLFGLLSRHNYCLIGLLVCNPMVS